MRTIARATMTVGVAAVAMAITAATTQAAPVPHGPGKPLPPAAPAASSGLSRMSVDILPGVHYTGDLSDRSVKISGGFGSLVQKGTQVQVQDRAGHTVFGAPFKVLPKAAMPAAPAAPPVPRSLHRVDDDSSGAQKHNPMDDFNDQVGIAANSFGLASGIGAMVGGVAGAVVGCPVGAITGGALVGLVTPVAPLGYLGGCIMGASAVGGLGAIVGGAVTGVPVAIASGVYMYNQLHADGDIAAPVVGR